ncbi:MAG: hypothetical protein KAQ79_14420 [Cyclobacteriaceae bacterium]|nr:hypothetical protein [Cyclobacteriaceae bacterium]
MDTEYFIDLFDTCLDHGFLMTFGMSFLVLPITHRPRNPERTGQTDPWIVEGVE